MAVFIIKTDKSFGLSSSSNRVTLLTTYPSSRTNQSFSKIAVIKGQNRKTLTSKIVYSHEASRNSKPSFFLQRCCVVSGLGSILRELPSSLAQKLSASICESKTAS